ncbi:MAG: DNA primase [Gammaproteobacteria bacterium]|nr:DNA primase [Gammaproteobacteria bacterium]MBU1655308.1 DNA primase [Gammaproteobacteria bacterium]MBU1960779.1 DNA primase [Gammaproteobacteria bacterium]
MPGKIPREFIDQLLQRTDIVDVVNSRVPLKRTGKDYQACCPFHDEKTPSFTVSRDKQFYHCFGCGAHGSAIGFFMEYERLSFPEAVEELARLQGIEVPRELSDQSPAKDLRPLFDVLTQADDFFRLQLRQHPTAGKAVDYLKRRGLSGEIAVEYGIGYAPPGWDNLLRELGPRFGSPLLTQAGLITEAEAGKGYDRFRDRIIFPIRDSRGRVVGFGGRVLGDDKPKYLNSPETPVFHKGRQLYGLYEMTKALRRPEQLLVVEGYMDVVALAQQGIRYAVATLGTATTADHLERAFRLTTEVVFCFDGDRAGREAGWKALRLVLPLMTQGRGARFLFLPEGEDPDSLVRKEGAESFERRVREAEPLSDYLLKQLATEADMGSLDGRARFAEAARGHIEQLPDGLFKQMMWRRLAERSGAPIEELAPKAAPVSTYRRPVFKEPTRHFRGATPVRQAITLLLKEPGLALLADLPADWRALDAPGISLLRELMDVIGQEPAIDPGRLLEHWRAEEAFRHLVVLSGIRPDIPQEGYKAEFRDCLKRLQRESWRQEFTRLTAQGGGALSLPEQERVKLLAKLIAEKG